MVNTHLVGQTARTPTFEIIEAVQAEGALEFESLRALLSRYVRSPLGRTELARVTPLVDRVAIESALADTTESVEYLRTSSHPQTAGRGAAIRPRFDLAVDPAPFVGRLRIEGATLEAEEIFELTRLLDVASEVRSVVGSEGTSRLAGHASAIADLRGCEARQNSPDGTPTTSVCRTFARTANDSAGRLRNRCFHGLITKTEPCRKIS
jgi:dsDNA-specific endonuclease/ATPase MutS2